MVLNKFFKAMTSSINPIYASNQFINRLLFKSRLQPV